MSMLTVLTGYAPAPVGAGVRLRDRVAARVRARALDAALAAGENPSSSVRLALRAHAITGPVIRARLARRLERVIAGAGRPAGLRPTAVTIYRRRVVGQAASELASLVARLRDPAQVRPEGVAMVIALLGDGAGPLHLGTVEPDLRAAARQASARLDARAGPRPDRTAATSAGPVRRRG